MSGWEQICILSSDDIEDVITDVKRENDSNFKIGNDLISLMSKILSEEEQKFLNVLSLEKKHRSNLDELEKYSDSNKKINTSDEISENLKKDRETMKNIQKKLEGFIKSLRKPHAF